MGKPALEMQGKLDRSNFDVVESADGGITVTLSGWNLLTFYSDGLHLCHGLPHDCPLPVEGEPGEGRLRMEENPHG